MKTFKILLIILPTVYLFNFFKKSPINITMIFKKKRHKNHVESYSKLLCFTQAKISTLGWGKRTKNMCILRKVASQVTP